MIEGPKRASWPGLDAHAREQGEMTLSSGRRSFYTLCNV